MRFSGQIGNDTRNNWLNFGDVPDHPPDVAQENVKCCISDNAIWGKWAASKAKRSNWVTWCSLTCKWNDASRYQVTKLLCCSFYNQKCCCGKTVFQQLSVEVCLIKGFLWNFQDSSAMIQGTMPYGDNKLPWRRSLRSLSAFLVLPVNKN